MELRVADLQIIYHTCTIIILGLVLLKPLLTIDLSYNVFLWPNRLLLFQGIVLFAVSQRVGMLVVLASTTELLHMLRDCQVREDTKRSDLTLSVGFAFSNKQQTHGKAQNKHVMGCTMSPFFVALQTLHSDGPKVNVFLFMTK